jgi:hypothetical protein
MTGPIAYELEGRFDPAVFAAAGAAQPAPREPGVVARPL